MCQARNLPFVPPHCLQLLLELENSITSQSFKFQRMETNTQVSKAKLFSPSSRKKVNEPESHQVDVGGRVLPAEWRGM